jgi:hypothetical protein
MSEKYFGWSGYNYCVNNPVKFINPDGREVSGPYDAYNRLTKQEQKLVKAHPYTAYKINQNATKATEKTIEIFGYNGKDDASDAFRHTYWQALNAKEVGSDKAKLFSDAHESKISEQERESSQMDLHNNKVGNEIGSLNTSATNQELVDLVMQAILDGKCVILDKNGNIIPLIIQENTETHN